jgi:3-hydroxybutyryl-CoA dehydrogenase
MDTGTAAPEVVQAVLDILASIGKIPVRLTREVPGFLVNRMQAALMREALSLVDQGIASARDVDLAVRYGFGFRYAACGPILQKEHSGWDISHKLYQAVFPTLCNDARPARALERLIEAGEFGMKAAAGFVRWNEADMARERERYNQAMRRATALVREDENAPPLDWRQDAGA